jgi:hypothetical protein
MIHADFTDKFIYLKLKGCFARLRVCFLRGGNAMYNERAQATLPNLEVPGAPVFN